MDVDRHGNLYQDCVVESNRQRERRRETWNKEAEKREMPGILDDMGRHSPIPGNLDQKFAKLSESLLIYEPLALRLRDLWFGAIAEEGEGTRASFLTVDSKENMDRSVLPFGDALWTATGDGDSFYGRLPMELKEFSTLEKRRRTRLRSQLWTVRKKRNLLFLFLFSSFFVVWSLEKEIIKKSAGY
jgi:hypothetical protein